jgi:hypothetical protein
MRPLKKVITFLVVISLPLAWTLSSPAAEEMIPPGGISFQGVVVPQALQIYKELTQGQLYVDSRAKQSTARIFCKNEKTVSKTEAARMIEKAVLEQAGVVVTLLDSNRVSVAFNDSLPLKSMEPRSQR